MPKALAAVRDRPHPFYICTDSFPAIFDFQPRWKTPDGKTSRDYDRDMLSQAVCGLIISIRLQFRLTPDSGNPVGRKCQEVDSACENGESLILTLIRIRIHPNQKHLLLERQSFKGNDFRTYSCVSSDATLAERQEDNDRLVRPRQGTSCM